MYRTSHTSLCVTVTIIALLLFLVTGHAENLVSRPCGFVRIEVPTQGRNLVAMPFLAPDPSLDGVLAGQLTGADKESQSDRIWKWDAESSGYVRAVKIEGTGDAQRDGQWVTDFTSAAPSPITLEPGDGFLIENRQKNDQVIYLSGQVVLDDTQSIPIFPGLNLVGYPYSTGVRAEETALWLLVATNADGTADKLVGGSDGLGPLPDPFALGEGLWLRHMGTSIVWTEARPYGDLFPTNDGPPSIAGLTVTGGGTGVTLSILCEGSAGERLDVFYKDLASATGRLDTLEGWQIAALDLAVGGRTNVVWTDLGAGDRPLASAVAARFYVVGRADRDSDEDGVPDARERLVLGTDPGGTFPYAPGSATNGEGGATNSPPPTGPGGEPTNPVITVALGRVIYVNRAVGNDGLSGLSVVVNGNDGPKKTIKAGLKAAKRGDTVVIKSGHYGEHVNLVGRAGNVVVEGRVNLQGGAASPP